MGVQYVFPQQPGPIVRGMATAHSHPSMQHTFISDVKFVWPYENGTEIGQAIEPFYEKQIKSSLEDDQLYLLLALIDMIWIGRAREVRLAKENLKKIFTV